MAKIGGIDTTPCIRPHKFYSSWPYRHPYTIFHIKIQVCLRSRVCVQFLCTGRVLFARRTRCPKSTLPYLAAPTANNSTQISRSPPHFTRPRKYSSIWATTRTLKNAWTRPPKLCQGMFPESGIEIEALVI